jgi:putrescine---pyruvate transaminase
MTEDRIRNQEVGDPSAYPRSGGLLDHLWMGGVPRGPNESPPPLVLERGDGIYVWDEDGTRYIDAIASLETVAVGHGRREIHDAILAQLGRIEFLDTLRYTSRPAVELANRLAELAPFEGAAVHFASSGSEAVEAALKIVRQYHVLRGEATRHKIIARRFGYHGCTLGAMALDGNYYRTRRELFAPLLPAAQFVLPDAPASAFAELIHDERPETVAAVVIDPMATASGIYPPAPGFWAELRDICDRHGILLVADEVITAFGRTGRWFASQADGVAPDLITVSKALSSGYCPISAVLAATRVADVFGGSSGSAFAHGHTYGGHPVACAAALANLRIIERDDLVGAAERVGRTLGAGLRDIMRDPYVHDVRGVGMLWGIEVRDPERPGDDPNILGQKVIAALRQFGVLTFVLHPGNLVFVCPPLVISNDEARDLVDRIEQAISSVSSTRQATPLGTSRREE